MSDPLSDGRHSEVPQQGEIREHSSPMALHPSVRLRGSLRIDDTTSEAPINLEGHRTTTKKEDRVTLIINHESFANTGLSEISAEHYQGEFANKTNSISLLQDSHLL